MANARHEASLDGLPEVAIIENIAERLCTDDLLSLRATCRTIEHTTFNLVSKRCFTEKCIHFTSDSLKSLVEMYSSPRFKGKLKTLYVSTKHFDLDALKCLCGLPACHAQDIPVEIEEAFRTFVQDQQHLKKQGLDLKLLVAAMKQIKKLDAITIVGGHADLKHTVDYRGYQRVMRHLTFNLGTIDSASYKSLTAHRQYVFHTTLRALHRSKMVVGELNTLFLSTPGGLTDTKIPAPKTKVWQLNLTSITKINLKISGWLMSGALAQIAGFLVNCTDVTLEFNRSIESGEFAMSMLDGFDADKLKRLWLKNVVFGGPLFLFWLSDLRHIKVLKFDGCGMLQPSWKALLEVVLEQITIEHLHIICPSRWTSKVYFLPSKPEDEVEAINLRYRPTLPYHMSFTASTYPGCDEDISIKKSQCCGEACSTRGWWVCLHNRTDIEKFLPQFMKDYRTVERVRPDNDEDVDIDDYDDEEYVSDSSFEWQD